MSRTTGGSALGDGIAPPGALAAEAGSRRALIVGATVWVRLGLRAVLERAPAGSWTEGTSGVAPAAARFAVAEAGDPAGAVAAASRCQPDLLLLHLSVPFDDALGLVATVKERSPRTRILAIGDDLDRRSVVRLLEAGVAGCIGAEVGERDLLAAIAAVDRGEPVLGPRALGGIIARVVSLERERARELDRELSERERQVIRRLAAGWTTRAIARELAVAESTVKTYINRALDKLQVATRAEAIAQAVRRGLVD